MVNGGQPAGLRMPPACNLHWRKAQAGQSKGQRVHAELRIDQHVRLTIRDRLHPAVQASIALLEMRRHGLRETCLVIGARAEMECVEREAVAVEVLEPAFHESVPDRVV